MFKKNIVTLIFFFLVSQIWAQHNERITVLMSWQNSEVVEYKGSAYVMPELADGNSDDLTRLPRFTYSKPLEAGTKILSIRVIPIEISQAKPSNKKGLRQIDTIAGLESSWNIGCENKQNSLDVVFNPIYCDSLGRLMVVNRAEISINYSAVTAPLLKSAIPSFASNSVLAQGKWVKVRVDKSGIHQIDYATLSSWGFSNPSNVRIYGNGGDMLPRYNSELREDDLVENPVLENNNALLFYAKGVVNWKYRSDLKMYLHEINEYDAGSYYFITESSSPRKTFQTLPSELTFTNSVKTFVNYDFHEQNSVNLIKSGRVWVGEQFSNNSKILKKDISFSTPNLFHETQSNVMVNVDLVVRSEAVSSFQISTNGNAIIDTVNFGVVKLGDIERDFAIDKSDTFSSYSSNENTIVNLFFEPNSSSAIGWINSVTINTLNNLKFQAGGELQFRNPNTVGKSNLTEYKVAGASGKNIVVLDVSNPTSPIIIESRLEADTLVFGIKTEKLAEFVAFDRNASFVSPIFVSNMQNQNLHSSPQVDYVIVTPEAFLSEALDLAKIHSTYNNITPLVVTDEQIYNEFSSGKQDPMAIRAFMRMFYSRAGNNIALMPKYLLLYGDGSYDNFGFNPKHKSKIITYQSSESFHQTESYVSDDGFGFLDDSEGSYDAGNELDIGIGRFVINSKDEAKIANNKVLAYLTDQDHTDWQTRISLLAQDGDGNLHLKDADAMAKELKTNNPQFETNKIYTAAFRKESTAQFGAYPAVELAIQNALVNNGSLIFNYTGHGAVTRIAYDFLNAGKADELNNLKRLPFFVTATCDVSRFDNPEETSLGEHLFLNPLGGGIGLVSTTRVVYSSGNKDLNLNFYRNVFLKDYNNLPLRLGEVVKRTKNSTSKGVNKLNFMLLCDPALVLNYPKNTAKINELKNVGLNTVSDTINGLTLGRVSGEIQDGNPKLINTFNGTATITLYDKASQVKTLGNSGQDTISFEVYQNILFKGKAKVTNGLFTADFMVPLDVNYNFGVGKISLYAISNDSTTAMGLYDKVVVGGLDPNATFNDEGPSLDVFMNALSFKNGGETSDQPLFIGIVEDENGINTAGSGIGHDILLTIDNDPMQRYVLNSFFDFYSGMYTKGDVRFQLPSLSDGVHTATFRAWDCNNNSSSKTLTFNVNSNNKLEILDATLSPNPIKANQVMKISFNHDEPNKTLRVKMAIYSFDGTFIDEIDYVEIDHNGITPDIEWSPRTASGASLTEGIYVCKLWITTSNGKSVSFSKKFLVLR